MSDLLAKLMLTEPLGDGAVLLRAFCLSEADALLREVEAIAAQAPLRSMKTPGGKSMSVATTNSGQFGWITDARGYRYETHDPLNDQPWPKLPEIFSALATHAAAEAGFENFAPDACLINRYEAGAKMGLHQDKDEADFTQPIVSVSLGAPATFLWGGLKRNDPINRYNLQNGDVVVWGGPARLVFHGVAPLKAGPRTNLTFRRAR